MPPKCPREGEGEGENSSVKARLSLPRDTRGTAGTFAGSEGRRAASKRRKVSSRVGDKYRFQLHSIAIEGKQTLARGLEDGLSDLVSDLVFSGLLQFSSQLSRSIITMLFCILISQR